MNAPPSLDQKKAVRAELHQRLMELEYSAFEQVMKSLLYKSGYLSVHLIGRKHKRGRTPQGGLDLTARSTTELASMVTIAQLKQYRRVVSRRFIDELRGAMLRHGAEQGLLLTLSKFSKVAHAAARESNVAPITLIEGDEVLDLLFAYRIGVHEENGVWRLDREWLDSLQEKAISTYDRDPSGDRNRQRCSSQTKSLLSSQLPPQISISRNESTSSVNRSYEISALESPKNERGEMTWSTHVMAGISALWLLEVLPELPPENYAPLVGAAALGALLPDLDAAQSKVKHLQVGGIKPFLLPAQSIFRTVGHRTLLHSLLALVYVALAGVLLSPFIGWMVSLALWLGYASHLAADACTRSGIRFLYPRPRRFYLLPKRWRIVTGSLAEDVLFVLLSIAVLLLVLHQLRALST
jgi:membrane-bound metal-dependent hydrolase YbcI (DUF457 family)